MLMIDWVCCKFQNNLILANRSDSQRHNWNIKAGYHFDFLMLHEATVYVYFLSLTGSVLSSNWTDSVRQVSRRKEYEFEKVSCLKVKVDVQNTHKKTTNSSLKFWNT